MIDVTDIGNDGTMMMTMIRKRIMRRKRKIIMN